MRCWFRVTEDVEVLDVCEMEHGWRRCSDDECTPQLYYGYYGNHTGALCEYVEEPSVVDLPTIRSTVSTDASVRHDVWERFMPSVVLLKITE